MLPCHVGASRTCGVCFQICKSKLAFETNALPGRLWMSPFKGNCEPSNRRQHESCSLTISVCFQRPPRLGKRLLPPG